MNEPCPKCGLRQIVPAIFTDPPNPQCKCYMTDQQPKPMSVEEAKFKVQWLTYNQGKFTQRQASDDIGNLIAAVRAETLAWSKDDQLLPEDEEIKAAHPWLNGDHSTYVEAHRLIGASRSKGRLVDLVNWLLVKNKKSEAQIRADERTKTLARFKALERTMRLKGQGLPELCANDLLRAIEESEKQK